MHIFLASKEQAKWQDFNEVFIQKGSTIRSMQSLEEVQVAMKEEAPQLIILDLGLEGQIMRDSVSSLLMINAFVHTCLVSTMSGDDFHEYTEGLGILMPLPENPSANDAHKVLEALQGVA